ncbi:hypothetical protein PMAYCL1PPCAC_00623, partial [Pristionchus mayeri]
KRKEKEKREKEERERKEKEAKERREREEGQLAQLQLLFSQPLAATAAGAAGEATPTPARIQNHSLFSSVDDDVLVFESIDDMLDSETFGTDIFRASTILKDEWRLLGVPPKEALKTDQELLSAAVPRVLRGEEEREFGVFRMGDERPDMRVQPKKKKRRRKVLIESEDDECMETVEGVPMGGSDPQLLEAPVGSQLQEGQKGGASPTDDQSARDKKREMKEEYRLKKHLESIDVRFATDGDDLFSLLHGGASPAAAAADPTSSRNSQPGPLPAATTAAVVAKEKAAPSHPQSAAAVAAGPVAFASTRNELFELFHGEASAAISRPAAHAATVAAAPSPPVVIHSAISGNDLFDLVHMAEQPAASTSSDRKEDEEKRETAAAGAPAVGAAMEKVAPSHPQSTAAEAVSRAVGDEASPCSYSSPLLVVADGPHPLHPRAPRFAILPYPERPRYADGWWFRPSRPRPPPIESRKEARKKRREAEEAWKRQLEKEEEEEEESATEAEAAYASRVDERRAPADDMRARLLGALQEKKEEKPAEHLVVASTAAEKKKESATEAVTHAPHAYERRAPADDLRLRLLGALQKNKDEIQKPPQPLAVVTATVEKEEAKGGDAVENVLVDLSP